MDHMRKTTHTISHDGGKAVARVREGADQSKEAMGKAQKSAQDAWEDAQKFVQKYPSKAVGIALMAGITIGALLAFRKKH